MTSSVWRSATLHLLLLAAALGGCHSEPLDGGDEHGGWLRCASSAACSSSESCVCGVCVSACQPEPCAERHGKCVNANEQRCSLLLATNGGVCVPSELEGGWSATASSSSLSDQPGNLLNNPPESALDGDLMTRWSSGQTQSMTDWFQLDFGQTLAVHAIELDMGQNPNGQTYDDYPRGYFVRVSDTPNDDQADVLASGAGHTPLTHIDLKGAAGRYVFIRQTSADPHWWSIHELRADVIWPIPPATP